ncbi:hypothetical protein RN001_000345 [Aquatica leii]|uniref:Aminomethyltransferase folate-binding domain-containing protein n=1 Tax=Aquatica leii TaxID=1421715 RepID=A0AAN7Q2W0_9COLE|nr:hypothetical protein RN001_000345 [Aquatica leii]
MNPEVLDDSGQENEAADVNQIRKYHSKYTSTQVFSFEEECELEKYLVKSSRMHYGLTYRQARELAYQYASCKMNSGPSTSRCDWKRPLSEHELREVVANMFSQNDDVDDEAASGENVFFAPVDTVFWFYKMDSKTKNEEKTGNTQSDSPYGENTVIQYFECSKCTLKEAYEYFGKSPPFVRSYVTEEDSYIIEDPFQPSKRSEFLILGAHCIIRTGWNLIHKRWCSEAGNKYVAEHLKQRGLIKVAGSEVADFLQGLITNDIHHLDHGMGSMYTMFLNTKGRIMFDAILYRTSQDKTFLIECDLQGIDLFQKHLKMYRVRRKIDIINLQNEFQVYSVFNPDNIEILEQTQHPHKLDGLIVPCTMLKETLPETSSTCKTYKDLSIYRDPRIANLGVRIIAPIQSDIEKQISEIFNVDNNSNHSYRWFRYNLGVGEGVSDLPMDNSFPLEANCDYLHGVSFHKGCYIGQELTARTHHTGVVRKRLMPLYFTQTSTNELENNTIVHEGVNLGKLRGVEGNVGLGLLRIAKALELKEISVGNGKATTIKPFWWPLESPKERLSVQKT